MPLEWLIDQMKEWVIAQAYATMAWVKDWVTPVHVTGTLDPDATCTYHKAGTYNNANYYIRDDGEWFIWWNGVDRWTISATLGGVAPPKWLRTDPSVLGAYAAAPPTTGIATVVSGYGCPKLCFVNRGDPAAHDFTLLDFTTDEAWYDLDLSSIVPASAKAVVFQLWMRGNTVNRYAQFRTKGNAFSINSSLLYTQIAAVYKAGDLIVPLNSDRIIQYKFKNIVWVTINLTVKGWWY